MVSEKEILRILRPLKDGRRAKASVGYFRSELSYLGIPVTKLRQVERMLFPLPASPRQVSSLFRHTHSFEVRTLILIHLQKQKKDLRLSDWNTLKSWSRLVDNWEHADRLADLYACLADRFPRELYSIYRRWNTAAYAWQRRLSIVGLYYYSAQREHSFAFDKALPLVKSLLRDTDIYVQKGVGWTLRELFNLYPDQTFALLKEWAVLLPPGAWQAATEKLSASQKNLMRHLRQKKIRYE